MKLYILLVLLFYASSLKSQIDGRVIDGKDNSLLAGVNIYLQKDSMGIGVTDESGYFKIPYIERLGENDTIVFSYVGYLPVNLTPKELQHSAYQVVMYAYPQQLSEVTVRGEKGRMFLDYEILKDLPKAVYAFGSFIQEGKIYVVSGDETYLAEALGPFRGIDACEFLSDKMFVYDIATDTWTESLQKFASRTCHLAHYYKEKVFVVGGKFFSTNRKLEYTTPQIEIYDMDRDTVYIDKVNPHQAANPITFIYDDCLYIMGGTVKEKVFSNKIHILDLKTGVWYDTGITIPKERVDNMKGVLVGHIVYFLGGYSMAPMRMVRSYNLQTGEWKDLCELKEEVTCPGVAVNGNLIYIYEKTVLQTYNIRTNAVNAYYFTHGYEYSGLSYADGRLYIIGGCRREANYIYPSKNVLSIDVSSISLQ